MSEKNDYGCSQQGLYAVCDMAWNLCLKYLPSFSAYRARYTAQYVANAKAKVKAAKEIEGSFYGIIAKRIARESLEQLATALRGDWQLLKGYIEEAFEEDEVDAMLEAAGAPLYRKATHENWNSLMELGGAGNSFIEDHEAELLADDNMPADFATRFADKVTACAAAKQTFFELSPEQKRMTAAKLQANNAIFASVMRMLKDGKLVTKGSDKQLFTFNRLVKIVEGPGTAGVRGMVTDALGVPVAFATVKTSNGKYVTTTDDRGRYLIIRMLADEYTLLVSAENFAEAQVPVTLKPGVKKRVNVTLGSE